VAGDDVDHVVACAVSGMAASKMVVNARATSALG